ncbi:transposase [Siminovitchia acidinfaciens]|uniref:Transposase n=1 Tax=Siminovitchia acidinfaciens TaxID=2321395 RepID=A0A429Y414_9BACI|nr:DDE-type integrase/transposase/recombinase [Siminovitchia acidinfaciens]RST76164.1 transposase [Siminovitchia acidinfaciens]
MILAKNQLLEINLSNNKIVERILWIDKNYSYCFTIDIEKNNTNALPLIKELETLHRLVELGDVKPLLNDPYKIFYDESAITTAEKNTRDNRWDQIKELVKMEPDIYLESINSMIKRVYKDSKVSRSSIYKYLRLYWQRGMVKNSLIPDFRDCGGRGKRKKLGDKKTGRPKTYIKDKPGINVTSMVDYYFEQGLKECKESNVRGIKDIYNHILYRFFLEGYRYENNKKTVQLEDNIPTLRQFRYWYENHSGKSLAQKQIDRKGQREYNLNYRPVTGKSDLNINGPGAQYQIDSTPSDIYLISEVNPKLSIGKPTTYFVIDVFSRMITGMYVGIKEASWVAARLAIANTAEDKVNFCKSNGIDISESDWPVQHLPESILADRGTEFSGYKIETLIDSFGIRVENTPSYRADLKGIIEKNFDNVNNKLKPFMPGSITKDSGKRGEADPRLEAKMTLKEYRRGVINAVLSYNNFHWLKHYTPDREMLKENVRLVPIEIWKWGIKHRSGQLKKIPEDIVKLRLMEKAKGRVQMYGIHFKGDLYYTCHRAKTEGWFEDAAIKGSWEVELAYDPSSTDEVYIVNSDGTYEVCYLLPKSKAYNGIHFADYDEVIFNLKEMEKGHEHKEIEAEINLNNDLMEIKKQAEESFKEYKQDLNKSNRTKNIRENKIMERELLSEEESLRLSEVLSKNAMRDNKNNKSEEYLDEMDDEFNFIKNFQKERLNNE